MKHRFDQTINDFHCKNCRGYVSTDPLLSGVHNRNHCPYCLWSRHMDLYEVGDRLSACKAEMRPVGLALKRTNKKYGQQQGELMIIHHCVECGKVSVNRIAADDDAENILDIYIRSLRMDARLKMWITNSGIQALTDADEDLVRRRLFGWRRIPQPEQAVA